MATKLNSPIRMQATGATQDSLYKTLDEWFTEQGLEVETSGAVYANRNWTGKFQNRDVNISCSPRSKTKYYGNDFSRRQYIGHEFSISMPTPLHTRLSIVPNNAPSFGAMERFLLSRVGLYQIDSTDPAYADLKINVLDGAWATRFLGHQEVKQLLTSVFPAGVQSTSFSFQPGAVYFRMRTTLGDLTPDRLTMLLGAMCQLADIAELLPEPSKVAKTTWLEKKMKDSPVKTAFMLIGGFLALCLLFPLVLFLLIYLGLDKIWIYAVIGFVAWRIIKKRKNGK